ncbi:MAG: M48 family metalloprotease [Gammaproteobacteria bacterium]|nr:M48 family metalloprotease [Gammaproteobacteria bacterium]NNF62226.1 M48 family metalloprotease [Gammaproteobacteria bacterium]NNM21023.1 M48 family metalloprotease [Gammaproteobacteria bacterium]
MTNSSHRIFSCLIALTLCVAAPGWAESRDKAEAASAGEEYGDAALGRKYHKQIIATYGQYDVNGLAEYVQRIGSEVAAHAGGDAYTWHFTILDDESVNAFALPGGYIYITRALLAHLGSEAQLAAVLGHEIGHVTGRHAARQHTAARVVGKVSQSISRPESGFNLSQLFGAGLVRGYGREMELEADEQGARMARDAGYNPAAMLEVLEILKARRQYDAADDDNNEARGNPYHAMLASHPDADRRLRELAGEAADSGDLRSDGQAEFLQRIDGLAWSGSKSQGVVRGSDFLHVDLNFAISVPDGWRIDNLPDRLVAWAANDDAMMQIQLTDRTHRKRRKIPVEKFLQKVTGMSKWQSARQLEINGLPAFIATAREMRSPFGLRTGRAAVIFHGDNAYTFHGVTRDSDRQRRYDRSFDAIIESMRPLSGAELEQAQPLAIQVIQLPAGSSLADYSNAAAGSQPLALLRLLNGVYPDGEPEPGARIKIIR